MDDSQMNVDSEAARGRFRGQRPPREQVQDATLCTRCYNKFKIGCTNMMCRTCCRRFVTECPQADRCILHEVIPADEATLNRQRQLRLILESSGAMGNLAAPSPTSVGSQFRGVIDGTFEHGLFVTAVLGSQAVRGVLFLEPCQLETWLSSQSDSAHIVLSAPSATSIAALQESSSASLPPAAPQQPTDVNRKRKLDSPDYPGLPPPAAPNNAPSHTPIPAPSQVPTHAAAIANHAAAAAAAAMAVASVALALEESQTESDDEEEALMTVPSASLPPPPPPPPPAPAPMPLPAPPSVLVYAPTTVPAGGFAVASNAASAASAADKPVKVLKKRGRKAKDPNAPKQFKSAFLTFLHIERPEILRHSPDSSIGQITKLLGERWRSMTAEEKEPFVQKSMRDRVRFDTEMKVYRDIQGLADPRIAAPLQSGSLLSRPPMHSMHAMPIQSSVFTALPTSVYSPAMGAQMPGPVLAPSIMSPPQSRFDLPSQNAEIMSILARAGLGDDLLDLKH